ncbi:hypothetical protein RJT34_18997 [Clitoria ternatea]|uniref:THO1-MOS11 C-terminal domain-containing protein n=1 Tax=Clitoria ternatea TaxID=43366 RepID=A0AAN9P403_CLITE
MDGDAHGFRGKGKEKNCFVLLAFNEKQRCGLMKKLIKMKQIHSTRTSQCPRESNESRNHSIFLKRSSILLLSMATHTTDNNPLQENPNKTLDPAAPNPDADPIPAAKDPDAADSKTTPPDSDAPLSDVQKKMRRAERFGISVQLSEKEKRNSRAERFGTGSTTSQGPEATKSEELKRKARAERFGMPSPTTAADEEAKKKARLARFAPVSKTDPLEEDKRKARALRFSNPSSTSLSEVNGEGKIEPKAVIAGKAGGGT